MGAIIVTSHIQQQLLAWKSIEQLLALLRVKQQTEIIAPPLAWFLMNVY